MSNHDLGIGNADSDHRSKTKIKNKNINHFKRTGGSIRRQLPAKLRFLHRPQMRPDEFLAFWLVAAKSLLTQSKCFFLLVTRTSGQLHRGRRNGRDEGSE